LSQNVDDYSGGYLWEKNQRCSAELQETFRAICLDPKTKLGQWVIEKGLQSHFNAVSSKGEVELNTIYSLQPGS
jgi:hypothetical protein